MWQRHPRFRDRWLNSPAVPTSFWSRVQLCQTKLHATQINAKKCQAAVAMATECIESIVIYMNDDNLTHTLEVPPLVTLSATTKDNIVFYVAWFVIKHCLKMLC